MPRILGHSSLVLLLLCLSRQSIYPADEWPQFRGPTGQGLSTATNVPVEWAPGKNIRWTTDLPGNGWSSPILSRGRIYLTSAVEASGASVPSLRAICLDADNGKIEWNVEVLHPNESMTKARHQKNSLASPTPIVQGGRLYVHFGHLGTAALDLSGRIIWQQTELKYSPVHGNGGSPALVGDLLVFNCDGDHDPFVAALDAATGRIRWKTPRDTPAKRDFSFSTPLEIESKGIRELISAGSGFVGGYDPKTGAELWRVRYGEGYSVVPRPLFAHGLIFVGSGFDHPSVIALNPEGAKGDVTDSNIVWTLSKGAPNTPSMLVVNDEIYFVSDGGIATCADARTGKVHWTERLNGDFSASPIYAEGRIYFLSESGVGIVLKAGKQFELLARNDLKERTFASYAVADGTLFIRSESRLWRVGGANRPALQQ